MKLCKKTEILVRNNSVEFSYNGKLHNIYGPAVIGFDKYNINMLNIKFILFYINGIQIRRSGPTGIVLTNNIITDSYWDSKTIYIHKQYFVSGFVKNICYCNGFSKFRSIQDGNLKDNIGKEFVKLLPQVEYLFNKAGITGKINYDCYAKYRS